MEIECGGRVPAIGASLSRREWQDDCTPLQPARSDATCNGVDEDCDDRMDEDFVGTETECGVGACANTGRFICENGQPANSCRPANSIFEDNQCNGVDDDCDGRTDELPA